MNLIIAAADVSLDEHFELVEIFCFCESERKCYNGSVVQNSSKSKQKNEYLWRAC